MKKKIDTLLIGLGNIGMESDYRIKINKSSFLTHSSTLHNHKSFRLVAAVDLIERKRKKFLQKFKIATYKNLSIAMTKTKPLLIILAINTPNILILLKKIIEHKNIKYILFEKPLTSNIKKFVKIKRLLNKNKINFLINFQRSYNPIYLKNLKKIFKYKGKKKIIIYFTRDFLSNASHFLFLITPYIQNKFVIFKKNNNVYLKTNNLEIIFIKLNFIYSENKMEIYSDNYMIRLVNRNENFQFYKVVKDRIYSNTKILKKKKVLFTNSYNNQKFVYDYLYEIIHKNKKNTNFNKIFEKYFKILSNINLNETKKI